MNKKYGMKKKKQNTYPRTKMSKNPICEYCGSKEITQYPKEKKEMCEHCGYIQPITTLNQNKDG